MQKCNEAIDIKKVLIDFLRERKSMLLGYLFFSMAIPISNVYLPHLYGKIITEINNKSAIDSTVCKQFVYIFAIWIVVQLFWLGMNTIDAKFMPELRSHIRKCIVDKVIYNFREDYQEKELGGLLAELITLPDEIDHMFDNIRTTILPMSLTIIFGVGYFFWIDYRIGSLALVSIIAYLKYATHSTKACSPLWDDLNKSWTHLLDELNDCLGNLLNVYTAGKDKDEIQRLDNLEKEHINIYTNSVKCAGNFRIKMNLSYIFIFTTINILSFYLFSKGEISQDKVISILVITLEMVSKMADFVSSIDKILYEMRSIEYTQQVIKKLSGDRHRSSSTMNLEPNLDGPIIFDNVCVEYDGHKALKGINLQILPRQTVILMGEIGSGKSTLINCLIRLVSYLGVISINGVDTQKMSLDYLRRSILYIQQNPRLFNRTVYENINYGNNVSKETVQATLDRYGIPFDLNKMAGKHGQNLSGGQRQIIAILRALFNNAPILIFDEPTSSLDPDTKDFILSILYKLLQERTVILITHNPELMKYADKIVVLDKGVISKTQK